MDWNVELDEVKQCSKVEKEEWLVTIPLRISEILYGVRDELKRKKIKEEVAFGGLALRDGDFVWKLQSIEPLPIKASTADFEDALSAGVKKHAAECVEVLERSNTIVHLHPGTMTTFSSTDDRKLNGNFTVSVVYARNANQMSATVRTITPCGSAIVLPAHVQILTGLDVEPDIDDCVQKFETYLTPRRTRVVKLGLPTIDDFIRGT